MEIFYDLKEKERQTWKYFKISRDIQSKQIQSIKLKFQIKVVFQPSFV